jgi:hypothetical protein
MKLLRLYISSVFILLLVVSISCTGLTNLSKPSVTRDITEQFITDIDLVNWQQESLRISPDCKTVAFVNKAGDQQVVVVNGQAQKLYDEINGYFLVYSADSKHMAYPARIGEKWYMVVDGREEGPYEQFSFLYMPSFNDDGSRLVYVTQEGEKFDVVVDGQAKGPYDEVKFINTHFSPDGKHFAYAAKLDQNWLLVTDGAEFGPYQSVNYLLFSPDSQHLAFTAGQKNKGIVVYDGKVIGNYDEVSEPIFSDDSTRLAYLAVSGVEHHMVVDGNKGKSYIDISAAVFSPDSKKFAYKAQLNDGNWVMVLNEMESEPYVFIGIPVFSTDSQRLAFMVHDGEYGFVIIDGEKGPRFKDIGYTSIMFSPDSSRVAYMALVSGVPEEHEHVEGEEESEEAHEGLGRYAVVVDGKPSKEWNGIAGGRLPSIPAMTFSPDSKNFAYIAINDNWKYVVVDNNKESEPYDEMGTVLTFTPDNRALIYIAHLNDNLYMVVNGDKGQTREAVLTLYGGQVNFEADDAFSYLIFDGTKVFLITEKVTVSQ